VTPTPTPTLTPTPVVETQVYADPYAGYSVAHPVAWIVVSEDAGSQTLLAELAVVEDDPAAGAFLFCLTEPTEDDVDAYRQEFMDLFVDQDLSVLSSESTMVDGVDGLMLRLEGQPPDASAEIRLKALLAVRDGMGYIFLIGSPADEWEANQPVFDIVLESIKLYDAVARPTPTVVPTPTAMPSISSLVFASSLDEFENPLGITNVYPPGVIEVYGVFEYDGFSGINEYEVVFYRDGIEDVSGTLELDGDERGQSWLRRINEDGLLPGEYTCEIYVGGELLASGGFTVLEGEVVLQDGFSDPTSGWSTDDSEISQKWYEGGQFHALVKEANWVTYSVYDPPGGATFGDVYLEVDVALVEYPEQGGEVGIVTRRDDASYYQLLISYNGYYKIRRHDDDGWEVLVDWVESDVINQGLNSVNRLGAVCLGTELYFYVNGVYLDQATDAALSTGQIGLSAGSYEEGPGVHAVFDNIVVYTLY
jgi:hypothetical protein